MFIIMKRFEWIQFFILYYTACAIEYIETSGEDVKKNMIHFIELFSTSLQSNHITS